MRTRFAPRNFAGGEMAPWLDGISNEMTQKGCRTLENFIVKKQGQATQRPGTFFVNEVKDSSKATALVPVTIDDTNTYVLEIGDAYIRFYKNHARVTYTGTTTIYEVTSPWSTGDLSDLRWVYVPSEKSVLFTDFGGDYALRKLTWTSDNSWTLAAVGLSATDRLVAQFARGVTIHTHDLTNWERDSSSQSHPGEVKTGAIASGKNAYVTVTEAVLASTRGLLRSEDGETWTDVGPAAKNLYCVAGNRLGEFIAGGQSGAIYVSFDDGLTWAQALSTQSTTSWWVCAFDDSVHGWRIGGQDVNAYSLDGYTWISVADISTGQNILTIEPFNNLWVAAGRSTAAPTSGQIWYANSISSPWTNALNVVGDTFGPVKSVQHTTINSSLWVAVTNTNAWVYNSSNAQVWSRVGTITEITNGDVGTLLWVSPKLYLIAASSMASSDSYVWESLDGATFTRTQNTFSLNAVGFNNAWGGIAYISDDESESFDAANHFPKNTTYNEGRLILGPTNTNPSTLWGSKTDNIYNVHLGDTAEQAFEYELTGPDNVDIQWFMGNLGGIVVGTRTAEGILIGSPEEGITPLTAQFRWLSTFGSSNIQPVRVHDTIVFVQRGGEIIRGYIPQQGAYQSPDLTAFADHIAQGGVLSLYHQDDPQTMVYAVRSDGQLLALTFNGQMIAWSRIVAASTSLSVGIIESAAIIPTTGAEDEMWVIVNRKVAAGTKRYIEYFDTQQVASFADAHYVDCGVEVTSGTTFSTVGSLTHLAGEVVDALLDGSRVLNGLTVAASGTISLLPYSGTHVHAGLPYTAKLQTLRGDYGSQYGDGAGLNKRTSNLIAWVHDSSALAKFGPTSLLATETIAYSTSTALATEICNINFPGQWDRDNYIWCVVRDPRPFTLVAMLPDTETGDR